MLAKYKEKIFVYILNRRKKEIITRHQEKADSDFQKDRDVYYRKIEEEELTDIFDVEFWASYDAGLPHTPSVWEIRSEDGGIANGKVMLRFAAGVLPGWELEDKNICRKYVDSSELRDAKVVYIYNKKDGKDMASPQRNELAVSVEEMLALCKQFERTKL